MADPHRYVMAIFTVSLKLPQEQKPPGSARESDGDPGEGAGGVHRGGERHAAVHRSTQVTERCSIDMTGASAGCDPVPLRLEKWRFLGQKNGPPYP